MRLVSLRTLAFAALLPAAALLAQTAAPPMHVEKAVAMKTRDGITLYADIYRPEGDGRFPVLLQRTPYNKEGGEGFARRAVPRGYMVVVQDVRGRFTSEGEWYTFKHEADDGYDTIEWAAALPHSDGRVGMFGGSYVGATQMLAAIGHPAHLAGIAPVVTASNYHENWTYQGGAFEQWFNQSWSAGLAQDTANRAIRQAANAVLGDRVLPLTDFPIFNLAPGSGADLTRSLAPYYEDWLEHPSYDSFWKKWSIEEDFSRIQVPSVTIAAWYDIFLGGSLRNYVGLRDGAGNGDARAKQRLVVTIGGHAGGGRRIGELDFGQAAEEYDESRITLDYYDWLFQGKQNQFANAANPVRIFVMGKNEWRDEAAWPPSRAVTARYALYSGNAANSVNGSGSLLAPGVVTRTGGSPSDTFTYDPANPVPTVGGPLCCDGSHLAPGPRDQKDVETRQDVLVYTTSALDSDLEVTGPVSLELWAASTAPDTDFTAKLIDVYPDGRAINLTEGILRTRYRETTSRESAPRARPAG